MFHTILIYYTQIASLLAMIGVGIYLFGSKNPRKNSRKIAFIFISPAIPGVIVFFYLICYAITADIFSWIKTFI